MNIYRNNNSLWGKSASKSPYSNDNIGRSEETKDATLDRLFYEQRQSEKKSSVVDQAVNYANQLKASRTKSKAASLEKKKLQYNFKKISSQVVRSKNSVSARKAVQAAKREIMRLKRLKGNGEYDDEELQLAIDHAESMEKVAKKKEIHLEQEEMVERAHKGFGAALEEIEEKKSEEVDEENLEEKEELIDPEQELDVDDEYLPEYDYQYELQIAMEEYQQMMQEISEEIADNTQETAVSASDTMSEMMDDFNQEMAEMMEDMDLTELTETLYAPDPNMSEEDLKMLKIKHRTKEMKEIAEADRDYLKGMIEHEKNKAQAAATGAMSGGNAGSAVFGSSGGSDTQQMTVSISMPGAAAGGAVTTTTNPGSFSVSV
jgi:hypothetical protein